MRACTQILTIALAVLCCVAGKAGAVDPITLDLGNGAKYRLIPIVRADGGTIYFGETEVTNAMWSQFLNVTGGKRNDDVRFWEPPPEEGGGSLRSWSAEEKGDQEVPPFWRELLADMQPAQQQGKSSVHAWQWAESDSGDEDAFGGPPPNGERGGSRLRPTR